MATGPHWNVYGVRSDMIRVPPASGPESASINSTSLYLVSSPLPSSPSMVQFDITSHDQGWCSEPHEWSWTWFEVSILRPWQDDTAHADFNHTELQCIKAHPEDFGGVIQEIGYYFKEIPQESGNGQSTSSGTVTSLPIIKNQVNWQWQHHSVSWGRHNNTAHGDGGCILPLLEKGDRLAIWARAQFPAWVNFIKEARISVSTLNTHKEQDRVRENADNLQTATTHAETAVHTTRTEQETAINYAQDPVTAALTGDHKEISSKSLKTRLYHRYDRFGNIDDLETAIDHAQEVVATTPTDHFDRPKWLATLSHRLFDKYNRFGNVDDLEAAINHAQQAIATTPSDHPDRLKLLISLPNFLFDRFKHFGSINDLEASISHAQKAVATIPTDHLGQPEWLTIMSDCLRHSQYDRFGSIDDLEAAINYAQEAVATTPIDHPDWRKWLSILSNLLFYGYRCFGNVDNLEAAINHAQEAIATTPTDHPGRPKLLIRLSNFLSDRYQRFENIDDLEAAISHAQEAVTTIPTDDPDRLAWLNNLSNFLSDRYDRFGNIDDLKAAINHSQELVATIPTDHPDRLSWLNTLSNFLSGRYKRFGNIEDLKAAIDHAQEVVATTPTDHFDRPKWLATLSHRLFDKYNRFGNVGDLEAAINHTQEAIATTPSDHPDRPKLLISLSNFLYGRYEHFGSINDLKTAISYAQKVVVTTPTDHPDRLAWLNTLSNFLSGRYDRFGNIEDLKAAINHAQEVVATTPTDHPGRPKVLAILSTRLFDRYDRFGNIDDLEAAINYAQEAVVTTPNDHSDRPKLLANLSRRLSGRKDRFGNIDDLGAVIEYGKEAVVTTPNDHPDQGVYLYNLSSCLYLRYIRTKEIRVLREVLTLASMAANLSYTQPSHRMKAARRAIRIHASLSQWDDASELARSALQLLPLICGRSLIREDQQYAITQIAGLAADACSIFLHLGQPAQALQSLEFGRGLIIGYLVDSRSDPDQLQIDHPDLAQEYNRIRFILSRPLDSVESAGMEQFIKLKQKAPRELDQCLATIRNQPGYERFLLEPAVDELVAQATEGPLVIVNITDFGSHAVIILDRDVYSLDLPALSTTTHFNLHQMIQHFRAVGQRGPQSSRDLQSEIDALGPSVQTARSYYDAEPLSWLWEHCVEPILISIEDRIPDSTTLPRIWWIGTGVASSLPFHAAGIHGNSTQSAMDRSISSYTPTIKALAYSRSRLAGKKPHDDQISLAIVAMPTTPQEQPLPGVQQEIDAIYRADPSVYNIQVQMHPNSEAVLQAIRETNIVHFACHGSCDPVNPSESHLLLQNGSPSPPLVDRLTVRQISDQVVSQAYIAFLSACSTARVTAERFTDESIHLASAFQVAGFGHVIASLWSVDDAICATIARSFYGYLAQNSSRLVSNRLVAEALHTAVLEIRMTERPGIWASFVHYGA